MTSQQEKEPTWEIDTDGTVYPTCPYCGKTETDYYSVEEYGTVMECECGGSYECFRNESVTFTSGKLVAPKEAKS